MNLKSQNSVRPYILRLILSKMRVMGCEMVTVHAQSVKHALIERKLCEWKTHGWWAMGLASQTNGLCTFKSGQKNLGSVWCMHICVHAFGSIETKHSLSCTCWKKKRIFRNSNDLYLKKLNSVKIQSTNTHLASSDDWDSATHSQYFVSAL